MRHLDLRVVNNAVGSEQRHLGASLCQSFGLMYSSPWWVTRVVGKGADIEDFDSLCWQIVFPAFLKLRWCWLLDCFYYQMPAEFVLIRDIYLDLSLFRKVDDIIVHLCSNLPEPA